MPQALAGFLAEAYIEAHSPSASDEPSVKITVRIDPIYAMYLEEIAKQLDMSRTALATQILQNAILDAREIMVDPLPYSHVEQVHESIDTFHTMQDDAHSDRVHVKGVS